MGEATRELPRPDFNRSVIIEGRPERLTGNAGALILREIESRLGIVDSLTKVLDDSRDPEKVTHPLEELLRTSIFLHGLGWQDQDDADTHRDDPALRLAVSERSGDGPLRSPEKDEVFPDGLASQPTPSRLVRALSTEKNRAALRAELLEAAVRRLTLMRGGHRPRYVTINVNSFPITVQGHQAGSEYNGHYQCRCYHPLAAFCAETGDLLDLFLRPGNVHTADDALSFILDLLDALRGRYCQVVSLRCDAGFPEPKLLDGLDERRIGSVFRIKSNAVLDEMAEPFLKRPPGRRTFEPRTWLHEMSYRAQSWSRAWRVVLVVQEKPGELFLNHFFLLTNWSEAQMSAEKLLALYRQRGTAESHIGQLKDVLDPALSCTTRQKSHYRRQEPQKRTPPGNPLAANEVTLLLAGFAYTLLHTARLLRTQGLEPTSSMMRLRERVLRVPARVLLHARRVVVALGEKVADSWQILWRKLTRIRWEEVPAPS